MIRVNLLKSVTDRQDGPVSAVERKVSSPGLRFLLMALAVGGLSIAIVGWDIISSEMAKAAVQQELENQKQIAAQLESVIKEQTELEQKIKNIDTRIEAIKKLRANQAGPSAVLEALRERIAMTPGLYLESVDQKGEQLVIMGNSPNEGMVTQFGRSLEFSSGLFSNLNIETTRKDLAASQVASGSAPNSAAPDVPKIETINFTIKCAYTPSKAVQNQPGTQVAGAPAAQPQANAPAAGNPQIAKN
ncbi:MAG TPA: PilN domain-containing protein [Pyrinomonadaceae bacterium]|jgi:Tfp pilus assembly protein PilN|nr:PilN domain-containing protein [Pyrinomonadaceae bacterium]